MDDQAKLRLRFDAFELDEAEARLALDRSPVDLPPKAFSVLCALARQAGRLVEKNSLLDEVWGHRHVSESVLKTTISELRAALGDDAKKPRYIETVSRRGYRFIGIAQAPSSSLLATPAAETAPETMIGRASALSFLDAAWRSADSGRRCVMWVTGEPGVGKTTLLDHFLSRLDGAQWARGQCVDHFGRGEPYLPVLEALAALSQRDRELPAMIRAIAPTWMAQMPWLATEQERAALRAEIQAATQDRMLREMGELLDRYTQSRPLAIAIEDIHWSDDATVRLIDHIARRREPARLLWISTVRLADVAARDHPVTAVRHELRLHGLCREIALDAFSERDVAALAGRILGGVPIPEPFVQALHRHTDGLPLFVVSLIEGMLATGRLARGEPIPADARPPGFEVPEDLAAVIERRIAELPAETQRLLEAASACGVEFRTQLVADAMGRDLQWVEDSCDTIARTQQWIRGPSIAPAADGSLQARYAFRHALHRHVFEQRSGALACANLHRRIAASLEREQAAGGSVMSAQIASHHERGHDIPAALRHYARAADDALNRRGPREVLELTAHALGLLSRCPEGIERLELELALTAPRAVACTHLLGAGAEETRVAFERAYEIGDRLPSAKSRSLELSGLGWVFAARGEYGQARALAQRLYQRANANGDPVLRCAACGLLGASALHTGRLTESRGHFEEGLELFGRHVHNLAGFPSVVDLGVVMSSRLSQALSHLGFVDDAREKAYAAVQRADALSQPFARMVALVFAGTFEVRVLMADRVRPIVEQLERVVEQHAFVQGKGLCDWLAGWDLMQSGDLDGAHRRFVKAYEGLARLGMIWGCAGILGQTAECLAMAGQLEAARRRCAEAFELAHRIDEGLFLPDLHLASALIDARAGDARKARAAISAAVDAARSQQAAWLELRARLAACELQDADPADRDALRDVLSRLTQGGTTPLVRRARQIAAIA